MTDYQEPKKSKVTDHLKNIKEFKLPMWAMYIIAGVGLVALIYGTVQQFRIWRWSGMLSAAKIRMTELEAKANSAEWRGMRKIAKTATKQNKEEIKKIDKKIAKSKKQEKELEKKIGRMKPSALKKAFEEEGF